MISGEGSGDGFRFVASESWLPDRSKLRRVGRLGVEYDWKPAGTGGGLGGCGAPLPLLWGGMATLQRARSVVWTSCDLREYCT